MHRWLFVVILAACFPCRLFPASVCMPGSLASYQALGATGCMVGELLVNDFSFGVGLFGGGVTPIDSTQITVTPNGGAGFLGLRFSSPGFSVTGSEFVNYAIGYTWDPTGDIRGLGDLLDPGVVDVVTNGCVGVAFSGSFCGGTPVSVHVFTGPTSQSDTVFFPETGVLGIRNNISLNANGATAGIDRFLENDAYIPEPASLILIAVGLIVLKMVGQAWRPTLL